MTIASQSAEEQGSQLASTLTSGLRVLSANQTIRFTKYIRFVLPVDGYVFWIRADQTIPGNTVISSSPNTMDVFGSLHYSTSQEQQLDKTIAFQSVLFTTNTQIADFNDLQPGELYIGAFDDFRFSFSGHGGYYQEANLWHYTGQAIYPPMLTQIVDDVTAFDWSSAVVSNSLPIWLQFQAIAPVYPSFLVPENIAPPYIVAHIGEGATSTLQPVALKTDAGNWQLMAERVKLILYGFRNNEARNFILAIQDASLDPGNFGIMGTGIALRDGKAIQSELNILAQQKIIELQISYNQQAVNDSAIRYIESVLPVTKTGAYP